MDTYDRASYQASKLVTQQFSTSFSSASKLFDSSIRQDIYNVYGLVRIADEIVDTYQGERVMEMLDELEADTYRALATGFSSNIIVHAFAQTARQNSISKDLIQPFFSSMRTDIKSKRFSQKQYEVYIYGSAQVVGLMCLKVFCQGDAASYKQLQAGAEALGAAFQKVNFLRDLQDDYQTRGRYYFPSGTYDSFSEETKREIIEDIQNDFDKAEDYIERLPATAQKAVKAAYSYYLALLEKLQDTTVTELKMHRVRLSGAQKLRLLLRVRLGR